MSSSEQNSKPSPNPAASTKGAAITALSEQSLKLIIYAASLVLCLAVAFLLFFPQALSKGGGMNIAYLPRFHAFLNGSCAVVLTFGYLAIRQKRYKLHKTLMLTAVLLSIIFLISYVAYHSQAPATKFGGTGWARPAYFFILVTHIILAAVIVPIALFTLARAWRGEFDKHKKIARWTFPLWVYVAVTGVIVYMMMAPYYSFVP